MKLSQATMLFFGCVMGGWLCGVAVHTIFVWLFSYYLTDGFWGGYVQGATQILITWVLLETVK